jgi:hypothetical protein
MIFLSRRDKYFFLRIILLIPLFHIRLFLRRQDCLEVDDFDNKESCGILCDEGCVNCSYDVDGKKICSKCAPNYFFFPKDDSCLLCPKICPDCILFPNTWYLNITGCLKKKFLNFLY